MDETKKTKNHLTSPAAFVEGGVQDACDDACSICLEDFSESDPSTVTNCKHEFHLQCILEWCQRSSQCPMCWQAISLKDATSQELLMAVEQERSFRFNPPRNATIFHHPTLGDFELPHLPNDTELEERIIQHLAAAAAMGRAHHIARREGQQSRSTTQGRPQYMVFSSHPDVAPSAPVSSTSPAHRRGENEQTPIVTAASPSAPLTVTVEEPSQHGPLLPSTQTDQIPAPASGSRIFAANRRGFSFNNISAGRSSSASQDRAGPSDFHSFSESLKSRLNSVSMRYKESITKGSRGWKERLFSRNTSIADLGSEVKREVNAGLASVSQMMERLETRENGRATNSSVSNNSDGANTEQSNQGITDTRANTSLNDSNPSVSCATRPGGN